VDECQNMSDMELHTIMTRLGQRSRIIFCGDMGQTDLTKSSDRSGWPKFVKILESLPMVRLITYSPDDIVRSPLVKAYLLARLSA
jgi:phosphate starvation-inducible PhoH-like protein